MVLIGVLGNARAQGAEIEIPSLADAKADFDKWLMSDDAASNTGDTLIKRALGLKEG